jgi:hypothetical protein
MTRTRWLLLVLVLAAVGVGVAVLVAPGGDSTSDQAAKDSSTNTTTTTAAPATSGPATTTAVPSTTTPATTTPATTTVAVPGACGSVGGAIRAAAQAGVPGAAAGADVSECRLAASDASWALVQLTPTAGSSFAATTVILQGGGGSWAVVATGGTNAGCGKAPQQVIADLGQFCVGTGGSR